MKALARWAILLTAAVWVGPWAQVGADSGSLISPDDATSLVEMALQGRWAQLLEAARAREDQLPLRPGEALVAAAAALHVGDHDSARRLLERAAVPGPVQQVARVELGELLVDARPSSALAAVIPVLRAADTRQLREAAVDVVARALRQPCEPEVRRAAERTLGSLPRSLRRRLEVALAATDDAVVRRKRLGSVLADPVADQPGLEAARALASMPELTAEERWRVGAALYRQGLYADAMPLLESVHGVAHRAIPGWEVAFLRGRCAFRLGQWEDAASWYRRAIPMAGDQEQAADLEHHLGRALELGGQLDQAIAAARRAVQLRVNDDRRLFLAGLRLRNREPGLAALGVSRLRDRSARDRGELLLAFDELASGRTAEAGQRLARIRGKAWAGPAAVLAARMTAGVEDWSAAVAHLESAAEGLDDYWALAAREVMAMLPEAQRAAWRTRREQEVLAVSGRARLRALARWATLEPGQDQLQRVRGLAAAELDLELTDSAPSFRLGLARELWQLGLAGSAVRWDPGGLPRGSAAASAWSAGLLLEHGVAWRAIEAADAAWHQAASALPVRALPDHLRKALFPLPDAPSLQRVAADAAVPWPLVAAVTRAESRWRPDVVSAVGARGLMQLMPGSAAAIAKELGKPLPTPEELCDPALAFTLGASELARLLAVFAGEQAPAVAAYNAGEAQARQWLVQCGAGCTETRFVAMIGFGATRAYTEEVLAAATTYAELYPVSVESGSQAAGHEPARASARSPS